MSSKVKLAVGMTAKSHGSTTLKVTMNESTSVLIELSVALVMY